VPSKYGLYVPRKDRVVIFVLLPIMRVGSSFFLEKGILLIPDSASSDAHSQLLQDSSAMFKLTSPKSLRNETCLNRKQHKIEYNYESRLICCHVCREKNSCATRKSLVHPASIRSRWSKGNRKAHNWIQCTAMWITFKT